jgi:hypothetical protein
VDWEFLRAVGFVLLGAAGFVYASVAAFYYVVDEISQANGVWVALVAFVLQYCLAFAFTTTAVRLDLLLPMILIFLIAITLVIVISVGLRAHSTAGTRMALAALFTLGAYLCIAWKLL